MIEFSAAGEIRAHQAAKGKAINNSYVNKVVTTAEVIEKADFAANYPSDKFEVYSVFAIDKARNEMQNELLKAEGQNQETADAAFKDACKGLRPVVVKDGTKGVTVFVREKAAE